MANPSYVRSTDGNDADDGSTWALADATIAGFAAGDSAGDVCYVSQVHAESTAAAVTWSFAGSQTSMTKVICANDAAEPPTAVATTATVTTTGANGININGWAYLYGLGFFVGSGAVNAALTFDSASGGIVVLAEQCEFRVVATGSGGVITIGAAANAYPAKITWKECDIKFAAAGQGINMALGELVWEGGSVLSGSTAITGGLIRPNSLGEHVRARISGVDLSNLGAASYLTTAGGNGTMDVVFRDCKLPASWTGGLVTGTLKTRDRIEMHNCDNADTNYRLWVEELAGNIKHETTIIRTGGASDGTTGLSWKMATGADAEYPLIRLESPEIVIWNETTGSAITVTIHCVHDSVGSGSGSKVQDNEWWMEVMYLGTTGFPQGTWITDCKADVLATAANQADSTETWTTTGLTTPVKQKFNVTFTPQEKGFIHIRIVGCAASDTVYVCPKPVIS